MSIRRRLMAAGLALAALIAVAGVATPAAAATSAIEFSRDGTTWSSSLPGSVFGDVALVPSDAVTRSFLLRNNAPEAGYLRITLRDVVTDNLDFADALSLRADLIGWPGEVIPVSTARPCARLSEGPVVASGATARVDLTALLGQLDGLRGQGGHAAFQIIVSLSGQPLGLGASGCPQSGSSISGFPSTPFRGSSYVFGTSSHLYTSAANGWIPATWVPGTGAVPIDPTTQTPLPETPTQHGIRVAANTDRFYQEYDVALWLLGALLGAVAARVIPRRRHRALPQGAADQNGALR